MAVPTPPELIALSIPRFSTFRHSLIPLPASIKQELRDRSPKSVISDMRFISPGSSSSSSAERRTISDLPNSIKSQPGRGRSLRLSDEADPDPISQELGKVSNRTKPCDKCGSKFADIYVPAHFSEKFTCLCNSLGIPYH